MKKLIVILMVALIPIITISNLVEARGGSRGGGGRSSSFSRSSTSRTSTSRTSTSRTSVPIGSSRTTHRSNTPTTRTSSRVSNPIGGRTTTRSFAARSNKTFGNGGWGMGYGRSYLNGGIFGGGFYNPMGYGWYHPGFYYYGAYSYFNSLWLTSWMLPNPTYVSGTISAVPSIPFYFPFLLIIFVPGIIWLMYYLWYQNRIWFWVVLGVFILSIII